MIAAAGATLFSGLIGWLVSWIRGVDRKTTELEKEVAVIKAILQERERNK
jgi:hypothetical protein